MKKFILFTFAFILSFTAFGQAQIDTKKVKLADFTQKITKVVLTGNMLHDAALKREVAARWSASPYEFCTLTEFDELKSDANYYFLLTAAGQFKKEKEPGLVFLTLVKGGEGAANGIGDMLEVISFPFASSENPSGREFVFLPAILDMIQAHTIRSMENDVDGYVGLPNYTMNITTSGDMTLVFSSGDLSSEITPELKNACFNETVLVLDEEDADEYLSPEKQNTLVSYVVVPTDAKQGSFCYKMLFDASGSTLYYFRKHKITKKAGPGFLAEDIKRICAPRKK